MEQDPGEERGRADVPGLEEEGRGLVRHQRQGEGSDAGEGQHVLKPDHAEDHADERQWKRPAVASDDHVAGREEKHDHERDHGGAVEHGHVPGEGQRGVRQERAEDGDEHDDGRRQQGEQAATANPLQAPDGAAAGHRQDGRNRHRRNMRGAPQKKG